MIRILPIASECLTKYRVKGLLYASESSTSCQTGASGFVLYRGGLRRFDVPTTQVKFDHRDKSLQRVINLRHRKKGFRMRHKAVRRAVSDSLINQRLLTYFVILSSIDLGSRMKVGSTTLLRSAPGRSCEIICDSTFIH